MAQKIKLSSKIEKEVLDYVNILKRDKLPLKRVIVFGSYAKGVQHKWSDIDVCLVSSKFQDKLKAFAYLLKKANEAQSRIEPHPFHPNDFVNEDPLVWEIKKDGIEVETVEKH
ncbi:nucleotidyltransferase [bacterium (Candidatus Gribaldobacteria) CG_4_8_14_3_um_filter_42_11]|uniref:Nucleotidyltransferase n=2 Tax=Candidatus Gribaldobacteria TaxID=2798536 RepID=A0A2H0UWR6_9BACT|nr:MAG: nucleotidyltransferase [bacterium (Candidatus Gribaldobacteria) CG10_big_fil_rev_8_21_14_0_10_41_12]PIX03397.1 MAG: nucleotidyltransferase [bacterium (Candidatus Gribaldobacteria) CG_4_8_14_3_um_filter_42_11]